MNWYLMAFKKYAEFKGRSRRKEYWMFGLISAIISILIGMLDSLLGLSNELGSGVMGMLYSLFVFVPSLALLVRRLHDVGKSGWMMFIALIPLIGVIWLIVLLATDSQPGTNQYGPNPKEEQGMGMGEHLVTDQ